MTFLEFLILIFIFIEAWQLRQLIWTSRKATDATTKTNQLIDDLLNNPKVAGAILLNGIVGMAEGIKGNKKFKEIFDNFMKDVFSMIDEIEPSKIILAITDKMKKDEVFRKEVYDLAANIGRIAAESTTSAAKEEIKDSVKKTIEKEIPLPKKYRWAKPYLDSITGKKENAEAEKKPKSTHDGLLPL